MRTLWQTLLIVTGLLFSVLSIASERYIYVTGEGNYQARPDSISLTLEISAERPEAAQALQVVNQSFEQLIEAGEQALITKESIHAEKLTRHPVYQWQDNQRIFNGEQITREIKLNLRVLARYDDLLLALATIPNLRIMRQEMHFDDPEAFILKATHLALAQAQRKAQSMADTMQVRLGKVLNIEEQEHYLAQPEFMRMKAASAALADAPEMIVQKQGVSSKVRVRFELK